MGKVTKAVLNAISEKKHLKALSLEVDYLLVHLFDAYREYNLKEVEKIESRLREIQDELKCINSYN